MGLPAKSGKAAREEREKKMMLKHKFENRITVAKYGKEALDAGDYPNALKRFVEYLSTMAEVKNVSDIYSIRVQHFNPQQDITEMLMISHVYFEMARLYDAVPKFHDDAKRCLEQFVHFSVNQPYQVVNSELVRKHLKKSVFKDYEQFRSAYHQIYVQSKKCYVVTFCFGESHPVTQDYRKLKDELLSSPLGMELVRRYYAFSSEVVPRWQSNRWAKMVGSYLIGPILLLFAKTLLRFIIKKC